TLGSDRTVRVAARLSGERDWPEASGFLATVFSLGGLGEWFAETVDGRVNEVAPDRQRGFQAAQLPLAPEQPTLGLVYTHGRILRATVRARRGPLSNVFLHHTGPGSAALFVAWLDSGATAPWPAGEVWELSLELQAD
ncbi:MAG: hypothetical protein HUU35_19200, partial [Armatimonadetes bacterium]|nr:hypothetical protein [Armatimonadota bacterium]